MSRSSVIYGTFSIVWGFGAVILTVVLQRLAGKEDRYIFLAGSVLGGVYEYLCSVFTEIFLGLHSGITVTCPLISAENQPAVLHFLGDVIRCLGKICYPTISGWIEKLPPLGAKLRPGQLSC
ncbi:MAG: putative ABC transporter permease [Gallintestinimicrobium sp.]